jgi:hypothetical protein
MTDTETRVLAVLVAFGRPVTVLQIYGHLAPSRSPPTPGQVQLALDSLVRLGHARIGERTVRVGRTAHSRRVPVYDTIWLRMPEIGDGRSPGFGPIYSNGNSP